MGPSSPIPPVLLSREKVLQEYQVRTVNLSSCHPLTVVSRRERGKATLTHRRASGAVPQVLTAEPQCRSGALKRSQFNAYQFTGVIPPFSGLKGSARL